MYLKTFLGKDKKDIKKRVSSFLSAAVKLSVMNIKYDVNYATKEYRATVYYLQK